MVYLHVPFCRSFCTYCGFYSVVCDEYGAYAKAVLEEIAARREEIGRTNQVDTLYIGGGTPSVLPLDVLSSIVHSLAEGGTWEEFTIEVNPEDIVEKGEEYVRGLMSLGVNRISMGVQSFDDGILRWMNRRHSAERAEEAFRILRRCGIGNISIDLIFGLPQLDDETWSGTIGKALELAPEHISAYQLSIEEGSVLAEKADKGTFEEASDVSCRHQYDLLCSALQGAGYHHYEISNFALPGREAVHNSAYWRRVPYVGLGPGAHSMEGPCKRSWNSQVVPRVGRDGRLATYSKEEELLTPEDIRLERLMLALRTDAGLPADELYALADRGVVEALLSEGALESFGPSAGRQGRHDAGQVRIRIPEDRFFTSDEIIRELV